MSNTKQLSDEAAALLRACSQGDMHSDGPELLERAAILLAQGVPKLAFALQRKAEAERAAIRQMKGIE